MPCQSTSRTELSILGSAGRSLIKEFIQRIQRIHRYQRNRNPKRGQIYVFKNYSQPHKFPLVIEHTANSCPEQRLYRLQILLLHLGRSTIVCPPIATRAWPSRVRCIAQGKGSRQSNGGNGARCLVSMAVRCLDGSPRTVAANVPKLLPPRKPASALPPTGSEAARNVTTRESRIDNSVSLEFRVYPALHRRSAPTALLLGSALRFLLFLDLPDVENKRCESTRPPPTPPPMAARLTSGC